MDSVSNYLKQTYDIDIKPGKKGKCFKCGKDTFSIKPDDQFGKCFHPKCDGKINASNMEKEDKYGFHDVLEKVIKDFQADLIEKNQEAYDYIVLERKIHPQCVKDSLIGSIPDQYKFDEVFKTVEERAVADLNEITLQIANGNIIGRELTVLELRKSNVEHVINHIKMVKDNMKKSLKFNKWICFFYTNELFKITSMKLRKPNSKKFAMFKLGEFGGNGVFGLNLFGSSSLGCDNESPLLQVEGEFNQLALQSLHLNVNEDADENISYLNVIAAGSSNSPDFKTIKKINESPCIIYDNDDAGRAVIDMACETMYITAFSVPEGNDIDEYIRSFGDDYVGAWNAFIDLYDKRKEYFRNLSVIRDEIINSRIGKTDDFIKNRMVVEIIKNDMNHRVRLYKQDQEVFLFNKQTKCLIPVSKFENNFMLFLHGYGINMSENLFKFVMNEIIAEGFMNGISSNVHKFSYFDEKSCILYVYNNANQIYKIDEDTISLVDNGTDGIIFIAYSDWEPFALVDDVYEDSLLDEIIINSLNFDQDKLSDRDRQLLFKIWMFSLFFESIMPTKPILCSLGEKGSGKSFLFKKVGKLLFGENFDVVAIPEKEDDFYVGVCNNLLYVIDNADGGHCRWLENGLATVSTGATVQKRMLYTNGTIVKTKPHCFLGITSRQPRFNRDDVAERLLILRLAKIRDCVIPEHELINQVKDNRNKIMTEIMYALQKVIKIFKQEGNNGYSGDFRMSDFASFAVKVAKTEGRQNEINKILRKLSRIQTDFTFEIDPIFDLLSEWVEEHPNKFVTYRELFTNLKDFAFLQKMEFLYMNPKSFAQKMGNIKSNLEKYFVITEQSCGGNIKKRCFRNKRVDELDDEDYTSHEPDYDNNGADTENRVLF